MRISASNFRSLKDVDVELGPLNVLVGPNGAGKSNFLDLIEFLGDSARDDLTGALARRGGMDRVRFRGANTERDIDIKVLANVTTHSSETAPDEYSLQFYTQRRTDGSILIRNEEFMFKRTRGPGRRISVSGDSAEIMTGAKGHGPTKLPLRRDSLALSTLRRLPPAQGGDEVEKFANLFTTFRVFNVDVQAARRPGRIPEQPTALAADASNLAQAILHLVDNLQRYRDFLDDARAMIPGFLDLDFEPLGGDAPALAVKIIERGLSNGTYLADASFGTVRVLALLALLYDADPPLLTCIEEIDHGIHPYVFDRLVERMREASERTQLLIATHSPALVSRLAAEELIVVERNEDGSTRLPAVDASTIREKEEAYGGELQLGELWFSGSLGGVPQ
ncbi:AAA family ATPase [Clavibacter lycopersici]|uniref:AAA family ATPase n=1 Tax=Clavibacter lycopersici TaxID=2301718 RepID=UPI0018F6C08C|nr:AAA family ATPase [Clavibacter lycopersici]